MRKRHRNQAGWGMLQLIALFALAQSACRPSEAPGDAPAAPESAAVRAEPVVSAGVGEQGLVSASGAIREIPLSAELHLLARSAGCVELSLYALKNAVLLSFVPGEVPEGLDAPGLHHPSLFAKVVVVDESGAKPVPESFLAGLRSALAVEAKKHEVPSWYVRSIAGVWPSDLSVKVNDSGESGGEDYVCRFTAGGWQIGKTDTREPPRIKAASQNQGCQQGRVLAMASAELPSGELVEAGAECLGGYVPGFSELQGPMLLERWLPGSARSRVEAVPDSAEANQVLTVGAATATSFYVITQSRDAGGDFVNASLRDERGWHALPRLPLSASYAGVVASSVVVSSDREELWMSDPGAKWFRVMPPAYRNAGGTQERLDQMTAAPVLQRGRVFVIGKKGEETVVVASLKPTSPFSASDTECPAPR